MLSEQASVYDNHQPVGKLGGYLFLSTTVIFYRSIKFDNNAPSDEALRVMICIASPRSSSNTFSISTSYRPPFTDSPRNRGCVLLRERYFSPCFIPVSLPTQFTRLLYHILLKNAIAYIKKTMISINFRLLSGRCGYLNQKTKAQSLFLWHGHT